MTTQQNAHRFFYDINARSKYSGVSTSFSHYRGDETINVIGRYFSYSTQVAV